MIFIKKYLFVILLLAGIHHIWYGNFSKREKNASQKVSTHQNASPQQRLSAQERELHKTLLRIRNNGPFPYNRDGITFHNRERLLPSKPSGYYREYTVDTPGISHRGPRRVVTGGNPPVVYYYTEDHYRSFRNISGVP